MKLSTIISSSFCLILMSITGCKNTLSLVSSNSKESGSADGTSSSAVVTGQTSVKVTPASNIIWKDFTINLGADFLDSNICSGKSIFGRAGAAVCNGVFGNLTASNMYRNLATAQMTLMTEASTSSYASGYRNVPDVYKDDDGYFDSNIGCGNSGGYYDTCTTIVKATRPTVTCGTTQASVSARVTDCLALNGANATWTGSTKGISGEGTWKLVTRTAGAQEVWRDERTGLIWSDMVGNDTWCKASGNGQTDGYCDGNTNSYCAEGGPLTPAISGEDWTNGAYDLTKGGMGAVATASTPSVIWRLATRNDWLQAEINGVRYVLPNMLSNSFWSATIHSGGRDLAWKFGGAYGGTNLDYRDNGFGIRCAGH